MNINCTICTETYSPSSQIYATLCGHMFHRVCLEGWLERSETCPQCRTKATKTLLRRLYFNTLSPDGVPSLQRQLDASRLEIKGLKDLNFSLSNVIKENKSANIALKEQVRYYMDKAAQAAKFEAEFKNSLQDTRRAVTESVEELQSLVRDFHTKRTLSSTVTKLKTQIANLEKTQSSSSRMLKLAKNKNDKQKKDIAELKKKTQQLKVELQKYNLNAAENQMLKAKLADKVDRTRISQTSKKRQSECPEPSSTRLTRKSNP